MKKFRILLVALLIIAFAETLTGCYMISGQKMNEVKGTYKLTNYTYTPSYERREGYTPNTRDYINDEKYLYEDYLIVTGTSTGYYVHKEANAPAYVKEVTLSYEFDVKDSSKVEYVIYNDALTAGNTTNDGNRLGVSRSGLNFKRPSLDYTQLFTHKKMRSEYLYVHWEKVDKATDLSYAKAKVGELKEYDYQSFAVRGIYEVQFELTEEVPEAVLPEFQYNFYVIDPAKNAMTVTWYYASKETPQVQIMSFSILENSSGDWNTITIDGEVFTLDTSRSSYYSEENGIKVTLICVSNDTSATSLDYLVESRMPAMVE